MKKTLLAILFTAWAAFSWSQTGGTAAHGTVADRGKPLAGAQVVLTNQDSGTTYKAKTDSNGAFAIDAVASGANYQFEVFGADGQKVFARDKLTFDSSTPVVLTVDTSDSTKTNLGAAEAASHRYSKEEIDAMRAQVAKAQAQNTLITQALDAINGKQWEKAVPPLEQLIADDPTRYEFYQSLGEAQFNLGQYEQANQSLEKGIQIASSNNTTDPRNPLDDPAKRKSRIVAMLLTEGNSFLRLKKSDEAIRAFTRATEVDPNSRIGFFDLCVTQFNAQKVDSGLSACDKSIALDPNRADTYFLKGKLLVARAKRDKNDTDEAAAATALRRYLELAPEGPLVQQAKDVLAQIGGTTATKPETKK